MKGALFDIVDSTLPVGWVVLGVEGATLELGFAVFGSPGFWERFFDGDPEARRAYDSVIETL